MLLSEVESPHCEWQNGHLPLSDFVAAGMHRGPALIGEDGIPSRVRENIVGNFSQSGDRPDR
jgi:hypothetical protein